MWTFQESDLEKIEDQEDRKEQYDLKGIILYFKPNAQALFRIIVLRYKIKNTITMKNKLKYNKL